MKSFSSRVTVLLHYCSQTTQNYWYWFVHTLKIEVLHFHKNAHREQWSAFFCATSFLQYIFQDVSISSDQWVRTFMFVQPLLGRRATAQCQYEHMKQAAVAVWLRKRKTKKCNIIDSAVTSVSCHMELNPVIHKCVWRNEHVSTHGMSGQLAHVNDCAENCSSASLCTKPYEWKGTFHSWCKSWYRTWCGTDVNEKRTAWNWWQPRG